MKTLDLVVSERKIFYVFPMTPPGWARMDPRGTVGRIYKEDHFTLLHIKYESFRPCGFGEEIVLCFSHDAPGARPIWTPGALLAGFINKFINSIHCYTQGAQFAGFIKRTTIHCYMYTQNMKVVSEKKIVYVFSIVCQWELITPGRGHF